MLHYFFDLSNFILDNIFQILNIFYIFMLHKNFEKIGILLDIYFCNQIFV